MSSTIPTADKTPEQRIFDNYMKFVRTGTLETRADYESADFRMLVVEPLGQIAFKQAGDDHYVSTYVNEIIKTMYRILGITDYLAISRLTKCILQTKPFWYGDYSSRNMTEGHIQKLVFDQLHYNLIRQRPTNDTDSTEASSTKDRPFYKQTS